MEINKTVKIGYHFFTFVFLSYISSLIEDKIYKIILLLIGIFNLYDTYWFIVN
jgi:hypothetical protein